MVITGFDKIITSLIGIHSHPLRPPFCHTLKMYRVSVNNIYRGYFPEKVYTKMSSRKKNFILGDAQHDKMFPLLQSFYVCLLCIFQYSGLIFHKLWLPRLKVTGLLRSDDRGKKRIPCWRSSSVAEGSRPWVWPWVWVIWKREDPSGRIHKVAVILMNYPINIHSRWGQSTVWDRGRNKIEKTLLKTKNCCLPHPPYLLREPPSF